MERNYQFKKQKIKCERCGKQTAHTSTIQKYCPECRTERRREIKRISEAKRRADPNKLQKQKEYQKKYRKSYNKERGRELAKQRRFEQRLEVIKYYGGRCSCCGESDPCFLAIDHINGGGNKHRKSLGQAHCITPRWYIKNNFPKGFQVLCHNCNMAKGLYGRCPHEIVK